MIQRIQSLFLLLAAGGLGSLFALPLVQTKSAIPENPFLEDGAYTLLDHPALWAVFGLAGLLALVSIFLFKNRKLQMRLVLFALIGILAGVGLSVALLWQADWPQELSWQWQAGTFMPLIAILFLALAYRFIRKDDRLVRSMDRLR